MREPEIMAGTFRPWTRLRPEFTCHPPVMSHMIPTRTSTGPAGADVTAVFRMDGRPQLDPKRKSGTSQFHM
jgi:hypothetical protein